MHRLRTFAATITALIPVIRTKAWDVIQWNHSYKGTFEDNIGSYLGFYTLSFRTIQREQPCSIVRVAAGRAVLAILSALPARPVLWLHGVAGKAYFLGGRRWDDGLILLMGEMLCLFNSIRGSAHSPYFLIVSIVQDTQHDPSALRAHRGRGLEHYQRGSQLP